MSNELQMTFDPKTIEHLGLKMYSTLAPALAELISNAYDADASEVNIKLEEKDNKPLLIKVVDNGEGLSYDDINQKFLVIGRNRRSDGDNPSTKFQRHPTGKKGLGKLALFGLAHSITIQTVKDKLINEFTLDWDDLLSSTGTYKPKTIKVDEVTDSNNGTTIILKKLKRASPFDADGLANSLSRIFIFSDTFKLTIETSSGNKILIDNNRKYNTFDKQFEWTVEDNTVFIPFGSEYEGKIKGKLFTAKKPLSPQSGLRGITLFSRGKLVNTPEFFSNSTSSHFYEYLTGCLSVDFIDDLSEDVISTNRQSIDWENAEMAKLRKFLSGIVSQVNSEWRKKRKQEKTKELNTHTGINTEAWLGTMSGEVKKNMQQIIDALGSDDASETYTPVIKAIHNVVPEYPSYHWRHLHNAVQEKTKSYYQTKDYYTAFLEAIKKYVSEVKKKSGSLVTPEDSMFGNVFSESNNILSMIGDYKKTDNSEFSEDTKKNIQRGQQQLSQGIWSAGRNPLSHEEVAQLNKSDLFSEADCLDLLSLLSHLFKRLENSKKIK